ncbi:DUF4232 domain-containing protein [Streptomyces sp. NBC_01351]|uniref:DUF4232 domain-containing protein n=1 Tax=Streptomyces sp. NBC_01351 TaxID=2903833 RepID=UPI002E33D88B|nr:DUF4232 domain-containing protein [Streptomyces sp. NBC_01351]
MARALTRDPAAQASRMPLASALLACALLAGPGGPMAAAAGGRDDVRAGSVPPCQGSGLVADGAQRLGATRIRITVVNEGPQPCALQGHPTLALAGQGSPHRNRPLAVHREGVARPVQLAVGGVAEALVSFTPVLGEADGYCASRDAEPFVAPSMVVGIAGGRFQLALDDGGNFALCGGSVHATAFRPAS